MTAALYLANPLFFCCGGSDSKDRLSCKSDGGSGSKPLHGYGLEEKITTDILID